MSRETLPRIIAGSAFAFFVVAIVLVSIPLISGDLAGAGRVIGITTTVFAAAAAVVGLLLLSNATFVEAREADDDAPDFRSAEIVALPTMPVYVSRLASLFIRTRGGRVYVSVADFSPAFFQLRAATAEPPGKGSFLRRRVDGVDAFISPEVRVPEVRIRLSLLPQPHLIAYWRGGFAAPA